MKTIWNLLLQLQIPITERLRKKVRQLKSSYARHKQLKAKALKFRNCKSFPIGNDPFLPKRIQVHFYDVQEMIKLFLSSKDNWQRVQQFHRKSPSAGTYHSIKNSQLYQELSIQEDQPVLLLAIACDEVQPLASLYAKNSCYKLWNFYVIVILEGTNQRKLEQVFPLALIYSQDVGEIGLKRITEEIYEQFTEVVLNGMIWKGRRLQVRVMYIIGDNLSQNQLCGLTRSWSHGKCCRICHYIMADLATANTAASLSTAAIRTPQEYMEVIRAEANDDILPHGFTSVPVLHNIPYIHPNTNIYCLDLDHDFFLGCAVTWMTIIVNRIVFDLQWISPMSLRNRWKRFKFRREDCRNRAYFKFDYGKKEIKICNKVAHTRHLILMFSTVLYSKVENPVHPVWQFYLKVLHLTRLLLTRNHNVASLTQLEAYIQATLNARMNLTRTATGEYDPRLKSKEHNLVHYPAAIRWAGPLSLQNSGLCEQTHQLCKRAFGSSRCTINVLKTIMRRIDSKLISRSQAQLETRKVSILKNENGLHPQAITFYMQYNPQSRLKSVATTVGKVTIKDVIAFAEIGAPDGKFMRVLALVHHHPEIVVLAQPLRPVPLATHGLFALQTINDSIEHFFLDENKMTPVNAYQVNTSTVVSLHDFNLNVMVED